MNRKIAIVLALIGTVSVLTVIALLLVNRQTPFAPAPLVPAPTPSAPSEQAAEPTSSGELAAIALKLETEVGIEQALLAERGRVLELRFKTPELDADKLLVLFSGLFEWLDAAAPKATADDIRLVLTVNYADAAYVQVSRSVIQDWREGKITSEAFVSAWKRISYMPAQTP